MLKPTLAAVCLALCLLACERSQPIMQFPASSLPNMQNPNNVDMSVTGSAQLDVSPDRADISFAISVESATPSLAAQMLQAKSNALVEQFKMRHVEEGDIKLSTIHFTPDYEYSETLQKKVLKSYTARSTFKATLKDFSKIGELFEVGENADATSISLAYDRSDLPELKKKVRAMALEAARAKADQMANGLGIKMGRIVSVAETMRSDLQTLSLDITVGYKISSDS